MKQDHGVHDFLFYNNWIIIVSEFKAANCLFLLQLQDLQCSCLCKEFWQILQGRSQSCSNPEIHVNTED